LSTKTKPGGYERSRRCDAGDEAPGDAGFSTIFLLDNRFSLD
jgi:hypothetical protein